MDSEMRDFCAVIGWGILRRRTVPSACAYSVVRPAPQACSGMAGCLTAIRMREDPPAQNLQPALWPTLPRRFALLEPCPGMAWDDAVGGLVANELNIRRGLDKKARIKIKPASWHAGARASRRPRHYPFAESG